MATPRHGDPDPASLPFGPLLRTLRYRAGLTQEALAERAGIGQRSLQYLERGQSRPQRATVVRLADALELDGAKRAEFEAAAPFASRGPSTKDIPVRPPASYDRLPQPYTSFIGRTDELAAATDALTGHRLVSVVGPGGVGKTRFAVELAHRTASEPHDTYFIALSPVQRSMVAEAVGRSLGLVEAHHRSAREAVFRRLRHDRALVILDNCEHVVADVAEFVHELLAACTGTNVLATSREPLRIPGERVVRLAPFTGPDRGGADLRDRLLEYDASKLFLDRSPRPIPLTDSTCSAIAEICERVDGLPLAIELAAARLESLSPEQIVDRLDDRFDLLRTSGRLVEERHQTLRHLIDWSYLLLGDDEQWLVRVVATFTGTFTLEAAEALARALGRRAADVLDVIEALVTKSMLVVDYSAPVPRYRLLESVRDYARGRRDEAGESSAFSSAHARWVLEIAEAARAGSEGPDQRTWLDRIDDERDNARAAVQWLVGEDDPTALRLCVALGWLWRLRGPVSDGLHWLDLALAHPHPPSALVVEGLTEAADLADRCGEVATAERFGNAAVTMARDLGQAPLSARALLVLSNVAVHHGEPESARELARRSLALARESGRPWDLVWALVREVDWEPLPRQDFDVPRARLEEALAIATESGNPLLQEAALGTLGELTLEAGRPREALPMLVEAVRLAALAGDPREIAYTSYVLGVGLARVADHSAARTAFCEGMRCAREHGDDEFEAINVAGLAQLDLLARDSAAALGHALDALALMSSYGTVFWLADCLIVLARSLVSFGGHDVATALLGAASVTEPKASVSVHFGWDEATSDRTLTHLRDTLGDVAFDTAWAAGRRFSLDDVVPYTLREGRRIRGGGASSCP